MEQEDSFRPRSAVDKFRSRVAESANEFRSDRMTSADYRKAVLRGAIYDVNTTALWKTPTFKLLVFVSSTFTDTQLERNYLMDEHLFELREEGQQHGVSVIFVDMRWGIRDENTCDHKTWIECANGISLCKVESTGICFLSLQGDKYGYRPLPRCILQTDLDAHIFPANLPEELRQLIFAWYVLDDNAVPREYVLCNLKELGDTDYWQKAYKPMLAALAGVRFDSSRYANLQVGMSVTEWEVRAALSNYPVNVKQREEAAMIWSYRKLEGDLVGYPDYHDGDNADRLESLAAYMKAQLPCPHKSIHEHSVDIKAITMDAASCDDNNSQYTAGRRLYLADYKAFVAGRLRQSLQDIVSSKQQWSVDGDGVGLPGAVLSEMLHHVEWAAKKCVGFFGREGLIERTIRLVNQPHRGQSKQGSDLSEYMGISACVIGISGSGKTALMAKVASEMYKQQQSNRLQDQPTLFTPIIIRFCGTSPGSSSARELVASLCTQIEFVYDTAPRKAAEATQGSYARLIAYFHTLLVKYPVLLFVDSIDQLNDDDVGRSEISFLKGVKQLHQHTRVVVSCVPDELIANAVTGKRCVYMCETRLKQAQVPRVDVRSSNTADDDQEGLEDALDMLQHLLQQKGRTLSSDQWQVIRGKVSSEVPAPTALYVNMLFWIVSQWTSQVSANSHLPSAGEFNGGVQSLVGQIFTMLERDYGNKLVRIVFGILTLAVQGVSDAELEDLLSLDDDVLDFVFLYSTPNIRRLPTHVWIRLKTALGGLIVEGQGGGIVWYHRQLKEAAEAYLTGEEKRTLHELMALYFGNLVSIDTRRSRKIAHQDWTLCGRSPFHKDSIVNQRRCVESSHHLLRCGSRFLLCAEDELCSFASIVSKVRVGLGFQLISDLATIVETHVYAYLSTELCDTKRAAFAHKQRAEDYLRWLRKDIYLLLPDIISTLLNSAATQPSISTVKQDAMSFWFQLSGSYTNLFATSILFAPTLGEQKHYDDLLLTLRGHRAPVLSACFSPSGRYIASASAHCDGSVLLWDAFTGRRVLAFTGHVLGWSAYSLSFDPSGQRLAGLLKLIHADGVDCVLCVWKVDTGLLLHKFPLDHVGQTVYFSLDGTKLLVAMALDRRAARNNSKLSNPICCVIDSSTGQACLDLGDGQSDTQFAVYHPRDNSILYAAQSKSTFAVSICNADNGALISQPTFQYCKVQCLAFNHDGSMIASSCFGEPVKIWNAAGNQVLAVCTMVNSDPTVRSVVFSPDGSSRLAGASSVPGKTAIYLWDTAGQLLRVIDGQSQHISQINFSPNGRELVCASGDNTVKIFDISHVSTAVEPNDVQAKHRSTILALSASDNLLFSLSDDGVIKVWDIEANSITRSVDLSSIIHIDHYEITSVKSLHYHQDSNTAVCHFAATRIDGSGPGEEVTKVCLIDTQTWRCVSVLYSTEEPLTCMRISADGQRFAVCSDNSNAITIASIESQEKSVLEHGSATYSALCYSPDGSKIASACTKLGDFDVLVWIVSEKKICHKLSGHSEWIECICFSNDGNTLASACNDKTVRLWSVGCRHSLHVLQHFTWVTCISFNATGDRLVSGSGNCVILWETSTGKLLTSMSGQEHCVSSLQFSQDGHTVALGSSFDFRVRLWDVRWW
ncbi:NACHT domain-containing protein [archaeon]|nr:MAG: NACHT domain-containing protein [archaeon]